MKSRDKLLLGLFIGVEAGLLGYLAYQLYRSYRVVKHAELLCRVLADVYCSERGLPRVALRFEPRCRLKGARYIPASGTICVCGGLFKHWWLYKPTTLVAAVVEVMMHELFHHECFVRILTSEKHIPNTTRIAKLLFAIEGPAYYVGKVVLDLLFRHKPFLRRLADAVIARREKEVEELCRQLVRMLAHVLDTAVEVVERSLS